MKNDRAILILAALALAIMNAYFLYQGVVLGDRTINDEGGPMENAQAIFAGLAALVFFRTSFRVRTGKLLARGLALLSLAFVLREVDVDDPALGVHYAIIYFVQGSGRNIFLTATWLWFFVLVARSFRPMLGELIRFTTTRAGLAIIVAGGLLFSGVLMDKGVIKGQYQQFAEELLEASAYLLVLVTALLHNPDQPAHIERLTALVRRKFPSHFPPA